MTRSRYFTVWGKKIRNSKKISKDSCIESECDVYGDFEVLFFVPTIKIKVLSKEL